MTTLLRPTVELALEPALVIPAYSRYGSGSDALYVFGAAVLAVALFWAGLFLWGRFRPQAAPTTRVGLFDELARAHHLNKEDQALLRRAAAAAPYAAMAFTDPTLLDGHAESHPADAGDCLRLRERLFGA